jgi:F0F1-type ATP synthase membrane subunit b/b'
MKRISVLIFLLFLAFGPLAFGQEEAEGSHANLDPWKWANFVVLVIGLGYLVKKNAGPFFSARLKQMRKDITDAEDARKHSEARVATVERRLAGLDAEIASLRESARQEIDSEAQRLEQHTAAEIAKIQHHAEQEIASAVKAARQELKSHSAALAVGLAEQKIKARMTPDSQAALVERFVHNLK